MAAKRCRSKNCVNGGKQGQRVDETQRLASFLPRNIGPESVLGTTISTCIKKQRTDMMAACEIISALGQFINEVFPLRMSQLYRLPQYLAHRGQSATQCQWGAPALADALPANAEA